MTAKLKDNVGPEDFGISALDAEKARYYAAFLVAAERERCAKVCRDKAAEWLKQADVGDIPRDTARHAVVAAGQIEAAILRA